MILKLSSQGQLTLSQKLRRHLGNPRHFEARLRGKTLILEPVTKLTIDEAVQKYGPHGITQEVLIEALRVVEKRKATREELSA